MRREADHAPPLTLHAPRPTPHAPRSTPHAWTLLDGTLACCVKYPVHKESVHSVPWEWTGQDCGLLRAAASVSPPSFMANPLRPGIDPRPPLTGSLKIECPKIRVSDLNSRVTSASSQELRRYGPSANRSKADREPDAGLGLAAPDDVDPPVRGTGRDALPEGEQDRRLLPPVQRTGARRGGVDRRPERR